MMRGVLDGVLSRGGLRAVYQPIVELDTGRRVAYEALARGPVGTRLENPGALFSAARAEHALDELDWACRATAVRGALDAGMGPDTTLFVNVEPSVVSAPPPELERLLDARSNGLNVVMEVTERALVSAPAELLAMVARARELGWGVALDDVGAQIASLALMPFLQPDVIKLDLRLVQERPDAEAAAIIAAVNAESERHGSLVVAEGIETEAHLDAALAMGAELGQGWLFGRPDALPRYLSSHGGGVPRLPTRASFEPSTVLAAAGGRPLRRSTKPLLLEMSWMLERQAFELGRPGVVLSGFQTAERFTGASQARYAALANRLAFVGVLGAGMSDEPAPGVRSGSLYLEDPLVDEWAVAVVGPHFASALAARDLGDDGPDELRRFDYILTYDRDRVLAVASTLMSRITLKADSEAFAFG